MNFKTEFEINIQTTRDEETYVKQLYEVVNEIVPEENKLGKLIDINYLAKNRKNQITINWKAEDEKAIPDLVAALRKNKWLRRHCIYNIATVY